MVEREKKKRLQVKATFQKFAVQEIEINVQ